MKRGTSAEMFPVGADPASALPVGPDLFGEVAKKLRRTKATVNAEGVHPSIYQMYLQAVMDEVNTTFESTSSKRVRDFVANFAADLAKARELKKDPTSLFWSVLAALRQGDYADPNRKGFTIRKLKQRECDERNRALRASENVVEKVDPFADRTWKDVPTWAEIQGKDYVSAFGHRRKTADVDTTVEEAESTTVPAAWLQEILEHCRQPQSPGRIIEVKDDSKPDPDTLWYRICDFGGFFCVDEMWGSQVMSFELRENVAAFKVVAEFRSRLTAERASETPYEPDQEPTGDDLESSPGA